MHSFVRPALWIGVFLLGLSAIAFWALFIAVGGAMSLVQAIATSAIAIMCFFLMRRSPNDR